MRDEKRIGIIISYVNIVLNMIVSVFFTPFLIKSLGSSEYGVYKIVQSFSGQLMIMSFGIGGLVTRNIVYFDEQNKKKDKENFMAMAMAITVILSVLVAIIGYILYIASDNIFSASLTDKEIELAKTLMALLVINVSVNIFNDGVSGIQLAHEKFIVSNGIKSLRIIIRIITLVALLLLGFKSIAIVVTDLVLSVAIALFNSFYGFVILKEHIHYYYFDKLMFKSSMLFSMAVMLQAIVNQVNQNIDNLILGVMTDSKTVAVYSVALTIYTTYNSITTAITNVILPNATRMVAHDASSSELTLFVTRMGRYQFYIAGIILVGFVLLGKEFLVLWLGNEYLPVYKIVLILIIPMTIPLIQGSCNAILDAQLRRLARSVILSVVVIINIITSIFFINSFGYIGAAYGTAVSIIIGHIILLNIYYKKYVKLNILSMFVNIFKGILPAMFFCGVVLFFIFRFMNCDITWFSFFVKISIFIVVYLLSMFFIGMNISEKEEIRNIINSIKEKRSR